MPIPVPAAASPLLGLLTASNVLLLGGLYVQWRKNEAERRATEKSQAQKDRDADTGARKAAEEIRHSEFSDVLRLREEARKDRDEWQRQVSDLRAALTARDAHWATREKNWAECDGAMRTQMNALQGTVNDLRDRNSEATEQARRLAYEKAELQLEIERERNRHTAHVERLTEKNAAALSSLRNIVGRLRRRVEVLEQASGVPPDPSLSEALADMDGESLRGDETPD